MALVTGATGFIGSHLVRGLVREGWEVHAVVRVDSRLPDSPEFERVTVHTYDGSTDCLMACMAQTKPDVVFHLASLFLSQHAPKDVEPLVRSNVLFGNQLLEVMRASGVRRLVNTGTSWQHFNNENYNPVCLYAATKQAFEAILEYYVQACGTRAITLRLFDTYGPEDPRPKLFRLLEKASRSPEPLLLSPGDQMIDLVHVDDVVAAYLVAAERLIDGCDSRHEVYAVSSGAPVSLKQLVEMYEQATQVRLPIQWGGRPYREREVMIPWSRGNSLPNWEPKIPLAAGIERMAHVDKI